MINVSTTDNLVTVTLNRPDKANALTQRMLEQVLEAVEGATSANALILTGAGRVFSAGADLDAAKAGLAVSPIWEALSGAIANFPGLTIAALNGTAAGGAMGMVLACDLRLAVPMAKFFYPVMRLGFLPQPSDPIRMARLVGPARAKQIFMCGSKITADTAHAWGMVDHIAQPEDLLVQATTLAGDCLNADLGHVAGIKAMF